MTPTGTDAESPGPSVRHRPSFTIGAISVLKTSMRLSGNRTGEYRCSLSVRRLRRSFDHG